MRITAVIPTKNRPVDLMVALESICQQSRKPDQLIIIDQSSDTQGRDAVSNEMTNYPEIEFVYVHDPTIAGLVAAKDASLALVSGDVICFLEDDVFLEAAYIQAIESGFLQNDLMLGCSGVVTNPPMVGRLHLLLFDIFHCGIFSDCRPRLYSLIGPNTYGFIESAELSGGLSAWRREVFDHVKFDTKNGFHMLEDIEYSKRAYNFYGKRFFINPRARLAHYSSQVNRSSVGVMQERKAVEYIKFYKKNSKHYSSFISLLWLFVGLFLDAIVRSYRVKSLLPIAGLARGVLVGIHKPIILD